MSEEKIIDYNWVCPKCGEGGVTSLEKPYKFCPYCASELMVEVIDYYKESEKGNI